MYLYLIVIFFCFFLNWHFTVGFITEICNLTFCHFFVHLTFYVTWSFIWQLCSLFNRIWVRSKQRYLEFLWVKPQFLSLTYLAYDLKLKRRINLNINITTLLYSFTIRITYILLCSFYDYYFLSILLMVFSFQNSEYYILNNCIRNILNWQLHYELSFSMLV